MALYDCSMCVCLTVSETASVFREKTEQGALGARGLSVKGMQIPAPNFLYSIHQLSNKPEIESTE